MSAVPTGRISMKFDFLLLALQPYVDLSIFQNCYPVFAILEASQQNIFGVGLSAPRPGPNLEDQSIPICLGHHL
jgi:hypothetical protein